MGLKKTDKFLLESIELLSNIKKDFESASEYMSKVSLGDYIEKFDAAGKIFTNILRKINKFNDNWETDQYKVCSTLYRFKSHLTYYIRMCENASPSNYATNSNYISDSAATLALMAETRIKALIANEEEEN